MGDEGKRSWFGLRVDEHDVGEARFESQSADSSGTLDGAAELAAVQRSEEDVVGRDGCGQPWIVGEMPVEVAAYGHEAARAVIDESVGERGAFVGVVAKRHQLFELIDDEWTRRPSGEQRHWVLPRGYERGVEEPG